jgi:hypothetical protein
MLLTNQTTQDYWFGPLHLAGGIGQTLTVDDTSDTSLYLTDEDVANAINSLSAAGRIVVSGASSAFPISLESPSFLFGDGSPEATIYAGQGSVYLRRDSLDPNAGVFFKTTGCELNTGWQPIAGATSVPYSTLITRTAPQAIWPFDETSGSTAHDVSGDGWDLSVSNVGSGWTWADTTSPDGAPAPHIVGGGPQALNASFPSLTNNFAVAAWVNVHDQFLTQPAIVRQGDPYANAAGGGWTMHMDSPTGKFYALWSDGTSFHSVTADNASTTDAWHFVGFQYANGVGTLYVDGVKQSGSDTGTIKAVTGVTFGLANAGTFYLRGWLSSGLIWDRPLTAAEWASLAALGATVPAGYLLQSNGLGGSFFAPLGSGNAPAGYRLYADGVGGTYWAP